MADFTSKAIKETFISLLEERPLSKITVKDISEKCGINRNSFYYHYSDIQALIEEIIKEETEAIIEKYPSVTSIVECFDALVEFASDRKKTIMHMYRSVSREVFERNLTSLCEYFVGNYVDSYLKDMELKKNDKKTVITFYKSVCFGLIMEWLNSGLDDDFSREIRRIFILKKDMAKDVADLLQGQI